MNVAHCTWKACLVTFVLTVTVFVIVSNLTLGDKQIDYVLHEVNAVSEPAFGRSIESLLARRIVDGNRVQPLVNGEQIFPEMLHAIGDAKETITFETYIYWSGSIGRRFAEALMERARAGVRVHVLIDWWGGWDIRERYLEALTAAGVEVEMYNPPSIGNLARMNNRTHRKLLVIDGRIGFTGGVGIADNWLGGGRDPGHWRDTHFMVEGPVVAQMQSAFTDNWTAASGRVLHGPAYFPDIAAAGSMQAQMFTSASGGGAESAQLLYLMSIAAARKSIRISMAYFVPDEIATRELVAARRRGVLVQIILPGPYMDFGIVRRASRFHWGPLLRAGVQIYEYQPAMYHCKVMIVDETWTSVGSTNFDTRSFVVNDEANLNVLDAGFGKDQTRLFEQDLTHSRPVTLAQWGARPLADKVLDALAGAFGSQL